MTRRLWNALIHLARTQTLGFAALVISLGTGTAYAASVVDPDSVVSTSIKNGEVKKPDLGTASVSSGKVEDNSLWGADVHDESLGSADLGPDSVGSGEIADGSVGSGEIADGSVGPNEVSGLTGDDVTNDTLMGADILESSLGLVPSAAQGGTGRWAFDGACDPESAVFVPCSYLTVNVQRPGRLLVNGVVRASTEGSSDEAFGDCAIFVDGVRILQAQTYFHINDHGDFGGGQQTAPLLMVTEVLPTGPHQVAVYCNQGSNGAIEYSLARVTAVVLSDQ